MEFGYEADGVSGRIAVGYPWPLAAADTALLPVMVVGIAAYLGQLCLAETIVVDFPASPDLANGIAPIAEMLYGVRCWKDAIPLVGPPRFVFPLRAAVRPVEAAGLDGRQSLLLFSGGKDSTLAALTLAHNGYGVCALHVGANEGVQEAERGAAHRLGRKLALDVATLAYEHPEFRPFARRHAINWDRFPLCNVVPFGRDLALAMLALPVMRRQGVGHLSFGHDRDCRNATVTHGGKRFPRNDIESWQGAVALELYIRAFAFPEARLLPPLACLSELRILREMFELHPELLAETAFCFWGGNCGRCAKCLRYFIAQRLFRREGVLEFAANPLADGVCPELDEVLDAWGREDVLFDVEILYGLGRLVQRGDVRAGERGLERFGKHVYPLVADKLPSWEADLYEPRPDRQVPAGFRSLTRS